MSNKQNIGFYIINSELCCIMHSFNNGRCIAFNEPHKPDCKYCFSTSEAEALDVLIDTYTIAGVL